MATYRKSTPRASVDLWRSLAAARRRTTRALLVLCAATTLVTLPARSAEPPAAGNGASETPSDVVRIGIAPGTWGGVNRNDATAAIAAWAKAIMQQRGLSVEVETTLFETEEGVAQSLQGNRVDAVSMLAHQFLDLAPALRPDSVYVAARKDSFSERYVLLVHRDSGIQDLAGLRGGRLLLSKNARSSLAPIWIEALLGRRALGHADAFFKSTTRLDSASKVVLQVFFRQAEACVVTTNVFGLAGELNPQLHQQLRALAVSPDVVPALFYFLPGRTSRARELLEPSIFHLHESPAGQQVLTVFQCERMVKCPLSAFDGTRALLAEYDRLMQSAGDPVPGTALSEKSAHAASGNP